MPEPAELQRMINKCMKDKWWSEERCRRYIAGGIWGGVSPTPSDVHIIGGLKAKKPKKDEPLFKKTFTIKSIPIAKAGEWIDTNGQKADYDIDDLDEIARNTNALITTGIHEPVIKLGHNETQAFIKNDGMPAIGHISNVYRVGDQLFADFIDVPKKINELIELRAYTKISPEIYTSFKHPETKENIGKVLRGVSLLGADLPAMKGIGDITALYNSEYSAKDYMFYSFAEKNLLEVKDMANLWTVKDVEEFFPCCVEQVKKFMEEKKKEVVDVSELAEIITKVKLSKLQEQESNSIPECPEGYKWNDDTGKCEPMDTSKLSKEDLERKVCPKGWKWSNEENKCIPAVVTKTDEDEMDDEESRKRIREIAVKYPNEWDSDELDYVSKYVAKKLGKMSKEDIEKLLKETKVEKMQEDERPPKEWWDRCISGPGAKASDPNAYCGFLWYHVIKEFDIEPRRIAKESEKDTKLKELEMEVKKLQNEKVKKMFDELKEKNRNILLPKFDEYINVFTEVFTKSNEVVKFGEQETDIMGLFYKFLKDLVSLKIVQFGEILTTPKEEDIAVTDKERENIIKMYSEMGKGSNIDNIELSILAEKIATEKNISYRDALLVANKILNKKGVK